MSVPRLELRGISKAYGGVRALQDVSLSVAPGEVHAVLGENGAGKSTLVKIVTGIEAADAGEILLDGQPVRFRSPMAARTAGLVAVYQDPKLFPHLDVAENIFMGIQPTDRLGFVDRRRMDARAAAARQPRIGAGADHAGRRPVDRRGAVRRVRARAGRRRRPAPDP